MSNPLQPVSLRCKIARITSIRTIEASFAGALAAGRTGCEVGSLLKKLQEFS